MPVTGEISTFINGADVDVEWKIDTFSFLLEENVSSLRLSYYSPFFSFSGETWHLGIWPNGWSVTDSSGYVVLYLCKYSNNSSIKQEFSVSLKTVKGEKEYEEHCTRVFKGYEWHRFNRFIARSDLSTRRSELMPHDVLTVVCTMKRTTSDGSASNTATAECCHCKGAFDTVSLSSHQKRCMNRPTICPDCLEVVVLQKWLDGHECQEKRTEARKGHKETAESACVDVCIQTGEDGQACTSEFSINPHEKKVIHDFKELFLQKEDCDVIIKVKGSEIPAHKLILRARSPVFVSTFRHDMKENATGILEIKDCDPSPFSDFLRFLYCGDIRMISQENVFSLFRVADKYEVMDLRAKCLEFMKENMTVDTFCETITLALQHSETELIESSTDFFVKNAEDILPTVKWQTFAVENPTQTNELVIKFVKWIKHSNA